ncbi:hypothetical protein [Brenneria tiliae]|uniref:Saccharopine dehydrogenase NADP binding domain-containing protein n=1 Tax=Brenneria tiliae TaxID=2914984 RepID=A0ABT0N151_9GAMM|nr:hypothetical protein [Brenneria tiliae]MCL2895833.1 hypothetical protein [Brenneria tiliae]
MTDGMTIALLGANGAVGQNVLMLLAPYVHIRAGSQHLPTQRYPKVHYDTLNLFDDVALRRFCQGSDLVINCAAPSCLIGDRVARIAAESGIDYLDPGGDDALYSAMQGKITCDQRCIVSAGMLPGLSGVLPRLFTEGMDRVTDVQGYALSCEPFSRGGAMDFLASLNSEYGMVGLSLQQGELHPNCAVEDCQLPLASGVAHAFPFVTSELLRLAESCSCPNLMWFNLYPPGELVQWLTQCRHDNTTPQAVEQLIALSLADFAGRVSQHVLAVEVNGEVQGLEVSRACVIKASQGALLTAAVTAFSAHLCLAGLLPVGLHFAAEILPPEETLRFVQGNIVDFQQIRLEKLFEYEEGAL